MSKGWLQVIWLDAGVLGLFLGLSVRCWAGSWQTWSMRTFLPVMASELCGDLPDRELVVPEPAGPSNDDREWADYEATARASLISLELTRDTEGSVLRRIVLALDGQAIDWDHVEAILVDSSEAEPAARRAYEAETQEEADEALDELLEFPLLWYDIAERSDLCKELGVS